MSALRILLLVAEPGIALHTLFCAEAMGAAVHVAATARGTHLRWARACRSFSIVDIDDSREDIGSRARALDTLARDCGADIIVPGDLPSTRHLIEVKALLTTPTIPLPDRRLFNTMDNEFAVAELLTDLGCPTPKTVYLGRPSQISIALLEREIGKTIHFYDAPEFVEAGAKIIGATGYSGPAHFDGRHDERDGTIKFIECNPRFWASITASLHCGVNFVAEAINSTFAPPCEQVAQVKPNCYLSPKPMMVALLRTPWKRELWSGPNRVGLAQALRSIVPYFAEDWRALRRQVIERRRLSGAQEPSSALRLVKG